MDTIETSKDVVKSIYLLVGDSRVKEIASPPEATMGEREKVRSQVLHKDELEKVDLLLWHIKELPGNSSTVITYSLPYKKTKDKTTEAMNEGEQHE